jgi:hypothetical protein
MTEEIKSKVHEFASIANECPENLREKCFELLLSHYLNSLYHLKTKKEENKPDPAAQNQSSNLKKDEDKKQDDILEKDIHVKARQFLKKATLSIDSVNELFYKEGNDIKPLYDDLKTTASRESQIRIALLQALKNGLEKGDFEFNGEEVRAECQLRKCYDLANFSAIFNANKDLFDAFEKYSKDSPKIKLSSAGKDKLAEVVKELQ